jgi:hypothetical protein
MRVWEWGWSSGRANAKFLVGCIRTDAHQSEIWKLYVTVMGIMFDSIAYYTIRSPFHYPTMSLPTVVRASRATFLHRFSNVFDRHYKMLIATKNKRWIPVNVCYRTAELFLYVIQQLLGHQDWFTIHRYKAGYVSMNLWFYVYDDRPAVQPYHEHSKWHRIHCINTFVCQIMKLRF